jgi:hypothetical protein
MQISVNIMLAEGEELALEEDKAVRAVLRALKGKQSDDLILLTVSQIPKSIQLGSPPPPMSQPDTE